MFLLVSCTMVDMTGTEWKRLGERIVQRRTELGMRTTKSLAERTSLTPRMLGDIENGRRDNYATGTLTQIELALKWQADSIKAILAGGDPTPLDEVDGQRPGATPSGEPPPTVELGRRVMNDFIDTVGRTRESPPIVRASELLRVISASVGITRHTLIHDPSSAGRADAIDTLYAASNAIPYMWDALDQMKGEQNVLETPAQPDASTEDDENEEAAALLDDSEARRAGARADATLSAKLERYRSGDHTEKSS